MKKMSKFTLLFVILSFILSPALLDSASVGNKKKQRLSKKYKKWLNEEVIYIISRNEKKIFKSMTADEQREYFIKSFWKRRDYTPDTALNEFKEEHYRRIEYADKNFFEGTAGWRSDRGRIYIMFGPADFFESNPSGSSGFLFDLSAPTAEFPSVVWTYKYIPGMKTRTSRIDFTFVNYYNSGKYRLVTNPSIANALRNTSILARNVGYEDPNVAVPGSTDKDLPVNSLEQLQLMAELTKSRGELLEEAERNSRLRKLKGIVEAKESLAMMSFASQNSYVIGADGYTHMPISIEIAAGELKFVEKDERYVGKVNFYIEIKDKEGIVYQKNDSLEMSLRRDTYERRKTDYYQYKHRVILKPGEYFLHLVAWDEYSGNVGYSDKRIEVLDFSKKEFALSSVILARGIRVVEIKKEEIVLDLKNIKALDAQSKTELKVPEKIKIQKTQEKPFTFGNLEINPNTLLEYKNDDELVFFYQIYHPPLTADQRTAKLLIVHQIEKDAKVIATIDKPQEVHILKSQTTAFLNSGARYDLVNFFPGTYTLVVRVKDIISGVIIEKRINFKVK